MHPTIPSMTSASSQPASVDFLFAKLALLYGKHWLDMWEGMPLDAVKGEWSAKLAHVKAYQVSAALEHVGKFPPTLPEFKTLCDQFRTAGPPTLTIADNRRTPMPDKVRAQLAALKRK